MTDRRGFRASAVLPDRREIKAILASPVLLDRLEATARTALLAPLGLKERSGRPDPRAIKGIKGIAATPGRQEMLAHKARPAPTVRFPAQSGKPGRRATRETPAPPAHLALRARIRLFPARKEIPAT
jgi:hypothetical protein